MKFSLTEGFVQEARVGEQLSGMVFGDLCLQSFTCQPHCSQGEGSSSSLGIRPLGQFFPSSNGVHLAYTRIKTARGPHTAQSLLFNIQRIFQNTV